MVQRREQLRFPFEARHSFFVFEELFRQGLDRDLSSESRVTGLPDLPHPARAERGEDLVRAETRAGGETHIRAGKTPRPTARAAAPNRRSQVRSAAASAPSASARWRASKARRGTVPSEMSSLSASRCAAGMSSDRR